MDQRAGSQVETGASRSRFSKWWTRNAKDEGPVQPRPPPSEDEEDLKERPEKWSLGILNDRETDEVPGSILLLPNALRNEPLGLRNAPARTSTSSLPSPYPPGMRRSSDAHSPYARRRTKAPSISEKKKTPDGKMVLEPQPEESLNDPLNWPAWRRDLALLSLGFYCMLGGGMTPVLAAGFSDVAKSYHVSIPRVALTTGLYMMGLGVGSAILSPTAILFGKRPVYLLGIILFILSAVWCALSPNYPSLLVARIFMGLAVSPVECLPSATIAEIFYLHERAYRLGVYTLLLLSGKNLVPLVSAAIIESLGWPWVFWVVAMVVGFCFVLVFLFVPETFWDRTPHPHKKSYKHFGLHSLTSHETFFKRRRTAPEEALSPSEKDPSNGTVLPGDNQHVTIAQRRREKKAQHVGFVADIEQEKAEQTGLEAGKTVPTIDESTPQKTSDQAEPEIPDCNVPNEKTGDHEHSTDKRNALTEIDTAPDDQTHHEKSPNPTGSASYFESHDPPSAVPSASRISSPVDSLPSAGFGGKKHMYTANLRNLPPKPYVETLRPWNGRLCHDSWIRVAIRPFILFTYPAILWSSLVYALSIGWLIVLSESMSTIFENRATYNFTALQAGLVYISPFVGGVLGSAVAGKVSDIVVRWMSRRNDGIYEPEFRLVMAVPILVATSIGLMGYGWSAEERDHFIVPTIFFGVISFGCALGSTTSITFAVDSYRQYAGEALVTLNFSKNILHGLVFSLFFNRWLISDGPKITFVAIGVIQIVCLLTTIPMYIYGKRARMWTVRQNLMERF